MQHEPWVNEQTLTENMKIKILNLIPIHMWHISSQEEGIILFRYEPIIQVSYPLQMSHSHSNLVFWFTGDIHLIHKWHSHLHPIIFSHDLDKLTYQAQGNIPTKMWVFYKRVWGGGRNSLDIPKFFLQKFYFAHLTKSRLSP